MKKFVSGVFTGLLVLPALLCASDTNANAITITATRIPSARFRHHRRAARPAQF
jgi:hypothetical protein